MTLYFVVWFFSIYLKSFGTPFDVIYDVAILATDHRSTKCDRWEDVDVPCQTVLSGGCVSNRQSRHVTHFWIYRPRAHGHGRPSNKLFICILHWAILPLFWHKFGFYKMFDRMRYSLELPSLWPTKNSNTKIAERGRVVKITAQKSQKIQVLIVNSSITFL